MGPVKWKIEGGKEVISYPQDYLFVAGALKHTEDWRLLPWSEIERNVFRLQQRIYQAASCGDVKRVHNLQRLLLSSYSARLLAVRRVTQDNRGKRTPGVDGELWDTPHKKAQAVQALRQRGYRPQPLRRLRHVIDAAPR